MTNYSYIAAHCRGELFSPSGKWRYTVTIDMSDFYNESFIHEAVVKALRQTPANLRGVIDSAVASDSDYILVVYDPYHKNAYPVMAQLSNYK